MKKQFIYENTKENYLVNNITVSNVNNFLHEKNCLSSLLPYDLEKKIKGSLQISLREYRVLLEALSHTLDAYKNGEYEKFDALVGENACKIRAIKIALIVKNNSCNFSFLEEQIQKIKYSIDELLIPKNINLLMTTGLSFKNLLKEKKLSIFLTEDELFLLMSYLLTEVKNSHLKEKTFSSFFLSEFTDITNLKKYGSISVSFLTKLVKNIRISLSYKSVEFIKKVISKFNDLSMIKKSFDDLTIRYRSLYCIPIFWSIKAILYAMLDNNIPLVIHAKFVNKSKNNNEFVIVDEEHLCFTPKIIDNKSFSYVESSFEAIEQNSPLIIFEGIILNSSNDIKKFKKSWKALISSFCITTIILANAAAHRQYPDESLDNLITENLNNDGEYENHKILAEKTGFSIKNPKIFLIRHIYTSKLDTLSIN